MSAKITFIQKDPQAASHQAARVTVPKSAIQQREGKTTVLVLTGDRMQSQAVTIGGEFGDRVEIKQGLAGGETLVVRGGENLSDGTRVKVKQEANLSACMACSWYAALVQGRNRRSSKGAERKTQAAVEAPQKWRPCMAETLISLSNVTKHYRRDSH